MRAPASPWVPFDEALLELTQLVDAYLDLAPEYETPPWLFVLMLNIKRVEKAALKLPRVPGVYK